MMRYLFLLTLLASSCTKRSTVTAPLPALPAYEQEMVGITYGSLSLGDFNLQLNFGQDASGLLAEMTRLDGLFVTFDVAVEFFPFSEPTPTYLVLTPRHAWTIEPYVTPDPTSFPPLLLDCSLYTQGGTVWPPSGLDNFGQTNPVWPLFFFRVF